MSALVQIPIPAWLEHARCNDATAHHFFPPTGRPGLNAQAAAKQICATCPVRADCLQHALDHNETVGVWGGLTAYERHRMTSGGAR